MFVNDSLASDRKGVRIFRITNDASTFAINNDSLGTIENYGRMEIDGADHDGLSNTGSITNYKNGTLLLKFISGQSWLQKNGGYLDNQEGSKLEIQYRAIDGSPLVVDPGGLIDGYSEILITELQE